MKKLTLMTLALALTACGTAEDKPAKPETAKAEGKAEAKAPEPEPAEELPDIAKAEQAARLANAIEKDPDAADKLLAAESLSLEDFDTLLFEVAQDPLLAEAYAKARDT
jgi:hypothetical protein